MDEPSQHTLPTEYAVGFLIEDAKNHVTLCALWGDFDGDGPIQTNARVVIPRGCILNQKEIHVETER